MKMREAFKALLDGERITRPDWDDAYIIYDDDIYHNRFIGILNGKVIGATKQPIFAESISHCKMIEFRFHGEEESMIISLIDDDKNEIYVSEEEKMELDAMKWRIEGFGEDDDCENCILADNEYCLCDPFPCKRDYLEKATPTKIREIYKLIKE